MTPTSLSMTCPGHAPTAWNRAVQVLKEQRVPTSTIVEFSVVSQGKLFTHALPASQMSQPHYEVLERHVTRGSSVVVSLYPPGTWNTLYTVEEGAQPEPAPPTPDTAQD